MVSGASDFGQIPVSGVNDLGIEVYRKKGERSVTDGSP